MRNFVLILFLQLLSLSVLSQNQVTHVKKIGNMNYGTSHKIYDIDANSNYVYNSGIYTGASNFEDTSQTIYIIQIALLEKGILQDMRKTQLI